MITWMSHPHVHDLPHWLGQWRTAPDCWLQSAPRCPASKSSSCQSSGRATTWDSGNLVDHEAGQGLCRRLDLSAEEGTARESTFYMWIKVANNLIWLRFGKLNSGPSAFGHTWPQQFAPTLFNFTALKQLSSSHAWLLCHEQHQTCWCITFLLPLKNTKILSEAQRTQDINLHCHIGLDCPIDIISLYWVFIGQSQFTNISCCCEALLNHWSNFVWHHCFS